MRQVVSSALSGRFEKLILYSLLPTECPRPYKVSLFWAAKVGLYKVLNNFFGADMGGYKVHQIYPKIGGY